MAAAEIAAGEMSPAEVRTGEVPAKMHASEMAAPKSAKMAKAAEMTKAAKVPEPAKVPAAKVPAAKVPEPAKVPAAKASSEAATSKGKGVAHRALKAEPEREHHRENLRRPTDH